VSDLTVFIGYRILGLFWRQKVCHKIVDGRRV
jgi:hypothetical protein